MGLFNEKNLIKIQQEEQIVKKRTILIVDDEEHNLNTLKDTLVDDYDVLTAVDGQDALNLLEKDQNPSRIHLIISDQRMPNMTGVEFLAKSIEIVPQTIRIVLTAYTDVDAIMDSINQAKIYKFILKPFDTHDIQLTIKRGLEAYDLEERNKQLVDALKFLNESLFKHLRGNLQKVTAATELLSKGDEGTFSEEQLKLLVQLQQGGDDLVHLLNRASELSFVYTGHKSLRKEQLDIIDLIRQEVKEFQAQKAEGELLLSFERLLKSPNESYQSLYLEIDRELFCKSLREILDNAVIYSEKPAQIVLSAFVQNNRFYLSTKDQGIGLEKEGGLKLMRPFARGQQSYQYKEFGFGIGLAKAKSYLEIQSGELTILPQEKGSNLLIMLPLSGLTHIDTLLEEANHRILIYQENESDLNLYTKVLEFEGHDVLPLLQPEKVIESIETWQPDAILLDPFFNQEPTLHLLSKIHELQTKKRIAIIILADDPSLQYKQEYLDAGAAEYISKPIDYEQLKKLI